MPQSTLVVACSRDNTGWESGVNWSSAITQQFSILMMIKARTGLHVIVHEGEDGWFVARCLELPAAISQGKTREEAIRNIEEAISLVLEDMQEALEVLSNTDYQWSHV